MYSAQRASARAHAGAAATLQSGSAMSALEDTRRWQMHCRLRSRCTKSGRCGEWRAGASGGKIGMAVVVWPASQLADVQRGRPRCDADPGLQQQRQLGRPGLSALRLPVAPWTDPRAWRICLGQKAASVILTTDPVDWGPESSKGPWSWE